MDQQESRMSRFLLALKMGAAPLIVLVPFVILVLFGSYLEQLSPLNDADRMYIAEVRRKIEQGVPIGSFVIFPNGNLHVVVKPRGGELLRTYEAIKNSGGYNHCFHFTRSTSDRQIGWITRIVLPPTSKEYQRLNEMLVAKLIEPLCPPGE